jgi:hypothetical protein
MALNTTRWTRMPHSMPEALLVLADPATDDETREFVAQVFGDNLDLFFRHSQTGGHFTTYEKDSHGCIDTPA